MADREQVLGVILAGGANRRFGSHKALARIGRRTILETTVESLSRAVDHIGIVANEPLPYRQAGVPIRPDVRPGLGALGGILTAVRWAREEDRDAALVLGCDMPFLVSELLGRLVREAGPDRVVLPASDGPRGFEPLCGAYGVSAIGPIERALERGDRAIVSFFDDVDLHILGFDAVSAYGDPTKLFWNVNRPEDLALAEAMAAPGAPDDEPRSDDATH